MNEQKDVVIIEEVTDVVEFTFQDLRNAAIFYMRRHSDKNGLFRGHHVSDSIPWTLVYGMNDFCSQKSEVDLSYISFDHKELAHVLSEYVRHSGKFVVTRYGQDNTLYFNETMLAERYRIVLMPWEKCWTKERLTSDRQSFDGLSKALQSFSKNEKS